MNDPNYILKFLEVSRKNDLFGEVFWHTKPEVKFFVICSDVFAWGCADLEPVETMEDIEKLDQACNDADFSGVALYAARRRGMRPQGACYKDFTDKEKELFDQCGPFREAQFGNPIASGQE